MRNRKKRKHHVRWILPLLALLLVVPPAVRTAGTQRSLLLQAGEHAALLAAALHMPDSSLSVLRERFRSELYESEREKPAAPPPAPPPPPAWPQVPEAEVPPPESEPEKPREPAVTAPPIPAQYRAPLVSENFSRAGSGLLQFGSGYIKNDTKHSNEEVETFLKTPFSLDFADTDEPQVLIVHTHATESFEMYDSDVYDIRNTWRSTDNNNNMVAVGNVMARVLEENGIGVLHDTTQHDYPSYNGSYERSAQTIQQYLQEYPSLRVVLDLHRDAIQREDNVIVKPVANIDGQKAAQIMIVSGCDDGTMNMPQWKQNLRFAAAFQDYMEQRYPGLTRPVFFCYRKYNMDLTPGSLLLEFGSNANTLEEAAYSAQLAGQALADLIWDNTP